MCRRADGGCARRAEGVQDVPTAAVEAGVQDVPTAAVEEKAESDEKG